MILKMVGWLFCLTAYQIFFGSFNTELSNFDESFKQFSLVYVYFLVYTQSNLKKVYFKQFRLAQVHRFNVKNSPISNNLSLSTQFTSTWSIDRTLPGATTPGQSCPGNDGNEGVLCIPQSSSITETLPSACLVSLAGYSLGRSYSSPEKQSVYSTATANWALILKITIRL